MHILSMSSTLHQTASAFTDKGSYSYNSGKGPLHLQAVLLYGASECSPVLLKRCILVPWLSAPFSMKGACFCCLDFSVMSWCTFYTTCLKSTHCSRHVHTPGKERFRSQWSLPLCLPVRYLTIPPCNPQLYPEKLHSILILMWCYKNSGYLPVLADTI